MQPFAAFLIAEHIQDLINDAAASRRAKAARGTRRVSWRRRLSARMLRLSVSLAGLARRLDPALHRAS